MGRVGEGVALVFDITIKLPPSRPFASGLEATACNHSQVLGLILPG
jgi:hypothetical protein